MQEPDAGSKALMKIRQMKFLVWRVNVIIRQAKAYQPRSAFS